MLLFVYLFFLLLYNPQKYTVTNLVTFLVHVTVTLIHGISVNLRINLGLLIWVTELP